MPDEGYRPPPVRGRPFAKGESGNPAGKPKGARHRTTLAVQAMLEGEIDAITRKAVEMALAGDLAAIKLCLDRIFPPPRERLIQFELPQLRSAADAASAMGAITEAVAAGEITVGEAVEVAKLIDIFVRTLEAENLERRLENIKSWQDEVDARIAKMSQPIIFPDVLKG